MAARDLFHNAVKTGLQKEGWSITHDPLTLQVGINISIDLGAERLITAEKGKDKIAVEVKSFVQPSTTYEFHLAIGQYRNYQLALSKMEPERSLYLAVPKETYEKFFTLHFIQESLRYNKVNVLVYDEQEEVIVKWDQ